MASNSCWCSASRFAGLELLLACCGGARNSDEVRADEVHGRSGALLAGGWERGCGGLAGSENEEGRRLVGSMWNSRRIFGEGGGGEEEGWDSSPRF